LIVLQKNIFNTRVEVVGKNLVFLNFYYIYNFYIRIWSLFIKRQFIKSIYIYINFFDIFYIIPSFTIIVRRSHDFKISGWNFFFFICLIFIKMIYLSVKDGSLTRINRSMSTTTIVFCYSAVILEYLILLFTPGSEESNKYGEPPTY
jgi:hypothetical protein